MADGELLVIIAEAARPRAVARRCSVQKPKYTLKALQVADSDGTSQQRYQPALAIGIAVDVALRGLDRAVAREQLHIAQAATRSMCPARSSGDESATPRVRRTAFDAEFGK